MDIQTVREFFLWCTILNGGLLILSSLMLLGARDWVYRVQSRWFPISREAFNVAIYSFVGIYKLFVLGCNLIPYLALTIVG